MDYFSILGVSRAATGDEIKSAFRKLALEFHPDRVGHLDDAGQAEAAKRMAEVNEAYSVLSNPAQRTEYEAELDNPQLNTAPAAQAAAAAGATPAAPAASDTGSFRRSAAPAKPSSNLARDFSMRLKTELANAAGLKFQPHQAEGFDWGLITRTWTAQYLIASRAFAEADVASAQRFLRYAEAAVESRGMRKQHSLFLMPFQKIFESAKVGTLCRDFCDKQAGTVLIVLMDMTRSEKLVCGPKPKDARLQELATSIKLPK